MTFLLLGNNVMRKNRKYFVGIILCLVLLPGCSFACLNDGNSQEDESMPKIIGIPEEASDDKGAVQTDENTGNEIICWGDSLTYGYGGEGVSYPEVLQAFLNESGSRYSVINMGACGEDSITIAGRMGGIPYVLKSTVQIPEGCVPVTIEIESKNGKKVFPSLYNDVGINQCTIAGITGVLSISKIGDMESSYTFTRSRAGNSVLAEEGTEIITSASQEYENAVSVIWIGTNGGYDSYEELVEQQNAVIASRAGNRERYLVVGIAYGDREVMKDYDHIMYQNYGEKYLNIREYLAHFGMETAGLEKTAEDISYSSHGMVPPSLKLSAEDVHFNAEGYRVIGQAIYEKLMELGYCDEELYSGAEHTQESEFVKQMGAGINIGNSLDSFSDAGAVSIEEYETVWGNPVITEQLFDTIAEAGFSTVRIPVTWDRHLLDDNVIDPLWMQRVQQVIDYAYQKNLYVIIDVHHEMWNIPTYENLYEGMERMENIWGQIASAFRDYDERLLFEAFNEPRLIGTEAEWGDGTQEAYDVINRWNYQFVQVIRNADGYNKTRYLIIAGYKSGMAQDILQAVKIPPDDRVMLAVHYYNENIEEMDSEMERLAVFSKENDTAIVVTEFGMTNREDTELRNALIEKFVSYKKQFNFSYIWWDNGYWGYGKEGYGILNRWENTWVFPDIVTELTKD